MALADIPPVAPSRRLDSWKEIADYIGRDVRTATRWETQGMPLHRIPGGRGKSVFAHSHEIDAWMSGDRPEAAADVPATVLSNVPSRRRRATRVVVVLTACALTTALVVLAFGVRSAATAKDIATLRVTATTTEISVAGASGTPQVIYRFAPDQAMLIEQTPARVIDLNDDRNADILTAIGAFVDGTRRLTRSGELLNLSPDGEVRWRFTFDDVLTFRDGPVRGPWALAAFESSVTASRSRIAIAGHDYMWWASMVAVIDDHGRRQGTFINPGWIESLLWISPTRLAVAGFNNLRNEAMLALLDPDAVDGEAPGSAGTSFACVGCSSHRSLLYATFSRSELNLVSGSRFNRAQVARVGDQIVVTTSEMGSSSATAMYEFDQELRFVRARYSEAYWDAHARLEREGRLTHTRETCPDRKGPNAIHLWDAGAGQWRTASGDR